MNSTPSISSLPYLETMFIEEFMQAEIIKFQERKQKHLCLQFCTKISTSRRSEKLGVLMKKKRV